MKVVLVLRVLKSKSLWSGEKAVKVLLMNKYVVVLGCMAMLLIAGCVGTKKITRKQMYLNTHPDYVPATLNNPMAIGCPTCHGVGRVGDYKHQCPTCRGRHAVVTRYGMAYAYDIDAQITLAALRKRVGQGALAANDLREVFRILDAHGTQQQYENVLVLFNRQLSKRRKMDYTCRYLESAFRRTAHADQDGKVLKWHLLNRRVIDGNRDFERFMTKMIESGRKHEAARLVWLLMKNKGYDQSQYLSMRDKRLVVYGQLDKRIGRFNDTAYKKLGAEEYIDFMRDARNFEHWLNAMGEVKDGLLEYEGGRYMRVEVYEGKDPAKSRLASVKKLHEWGFWSRSEAGVVQEEILEGEIDAVMGTAEAADEAVDAEKAGESQAAVTVKEETGRQG